VAYDANMSKDLETLAGRVKAAVKETKLSHPKFAEMAKMKLRSLQDVIYGQSLDPQMSTLQAISKHSGVPLDHLVFGDKREPAHSIHLAYASELLGQMAKLGPVRLSVVLYLATKDDSFLKSIPEALVQKLQSLEKAL
jgi:transcriptional regulator with XRE-family HTH domain